MQKIFTDDERKKTCESWKQSGLTKIEFCKQNNIDRRCLYNWLKKFQIGADINDISKSSIKHKSIKFLQVGNIVPEKSFLEVLLPSGIVFKSTASQDMVNRFLQELLKWK